VRADDLFATIAACLPAAVISSAPALPVVPDSFVLADADPVSGAFDRREVIERFGGDEELFRSVAAMFVQDSAGYRQALQAAVDAGDADALAREAHTVKGLLSTFSCEASAMLARDVELMAKEGRLDDAVARVPQVLEAIDSLASMLVIENA
jgi:HPt (histidine-containing phosphotransfer) domain-containing protein